MLHRPILSILQMFPRGSTNEQLIWRLRSSGLRTEASDLLASLNALVERGEIAHEKGRWFSRSLAPSRATGTEQRADHRQVDYGPVLRAIYATVRSLPPDASQSVEEETGPAAELGDSELPEWNALLAYYAATQRQDPRGQIGRYGDQHGKGWQLLACTGHWWEDAELSVPAGSLPDSLREALSRRPIHSAAIGWPVSVFPADSGPLCAPGLIVAATWDLSSEGLRLRVDSVRPALNPIWIAEIRRTASWTEAALKERLFPEGEPHDLGAVAERMTHALASLGGAALRPADLALEISVSGRGLRNAAALFLPEDNTFTRGVANDLEVIRTWTPATRRGTALSALLEGTADAPREDVPVLAPADLTERQMEAAEDALTGPLTSIQGPPGTGKSHLILALITSAVLAGRSVLLAARNHQALDEIENRLREIVPDAPLLIRGRDADGERDNSFLAVMAQIAGGECCDIDLVRSAELRRRELAAAGAGAQAWRRAARDRLRLNLALSELTERTAAIRQGLASSSRESNLSLLGRILAWLRKLRRRGDVAELPPDDASLDEIEQRSAALRKALEKAPESYPAEDEALRDIRSDLGKIAAAVTLPDESQRAHLDARKKEIEFASGSQASRWLIPEDARAILRHRPVWAISTLSVPPRAPLIPALFDYAVFDEASQCDIASALPILARARSAVIVGDPMQLAFIPDLGRSAEHALMDAAGLPSSGRALLAQSRNSLFEFVSRRKDVHRRFLADQFRSAAPIVDYLNEEFYARRLIGRRAEDSFEKPRGYKPGLGWEDAAGRTAREDGGNVNTAEAEQIVALLRRFAADQTFDGSVGVVSPFNAQVALIQRKVQADLPASAAERLQLRVATVDKWQGGEADVILFSLVLASGAPQSARTFLQKDRRRLNVAISRARALCLIVGDLAFAKTCGVRHIQQLARRATEDWSPPRAPFDSLWERRLDAAMRARGLKPFPQYPVGSRYLDFALDPEGMKLDVEVDGRRWHVGPEGERKTADRLRDRELIGRGWRVCRFWVHELEADMEGCLDRIERILGHR